MKLHLAEQHAQVLKSQILLNLQGLKQISRVQNYATIQNVEETMIRVWHSCSKRKPRSSIEVKGTISNLSRQNEELM